MHRRPFPKVLGALIAGNDVLGVGQGNDDPAQTWPIHLIIAVKPVITGDQVARSCQNAEMLELADTIIADLHVMGIGVKRDADTVRRWHRLFVRDHVAPVQHHALTAPTG